MARSITEEVIASLVSSTPMVLRPKRLFKYLALVGEEDPEAVLSRVESNFPLCQELAIESASADMEPVSLSLPGGIPGGELKVSEPGYESDGEDDDDDHARSSILITDGLSVRFERTVHQQQKEEEDEGEEEEEDVKRHIDHQSGWRGDYRKAKRNRAQPR